MMGDLDPALRTLQRSNLLTQALLLADPQDLPALAAQARTLAPEQESAIDRLVALGGRAASLPELLGRGPSAALEIDPLESLRRAQHPEAPAMLGYLRAAEEAAGQVSSAWQELIEGTRLHLQAQVEPAAGGRE